MSESARPSIVELSIRRVGTVFPSVASWHKARKMLEDAKTSACGPGSGWKAWAQKQVEGS